MVIVVRTTTQELNKVRPKIFAAWLARANLARKNDTAATIKTKDFDDKLKYLDKKVTSNQSKHLLVEFKFKNLQDNIKNLQKVDSSLFISRSYFFIDEAQLYLLSLTLYYPRKKLDNSENILSWKSKSLASEILTTLTTTDYSIFPSMN